jgi:hypothetical protein
MTATVFWVGARNFEALGVDTSSKGVPERILDHAGETINGILCETGFIKHDTLATIVTGECQFLEQVGKHVRALIVSFDAIDKIQQTYTNVE